MKNFISQFLGKNIIPQANQNIVVQANSFVGENKDNGFSRELASFTQALPDEITIYDLNNPDPLVKSDIEIQQFVNKEEMFAPEVKPSQNDAKNTKADLSEQADLLENSSNLPFFAIQQPDLAYIDNTAKDGVIVDEVLSDWDNANKGKSPVEDDIIGHEISVPDIQNQSPSTSQFASETQLMTNEKAFTESKAQVIRNESIIPDQKDALFQQKSHIDIDISAKNQPTVNQKENLAPQDKLRTIAKLDDEIIMIERNEAEVSENSVMGQKMNQSVESINVPLIDQESGETQFIYQAESIRENKSAITKIQQTKKPEINIEIHKDNVLSVDNPSPKLPVSQIIEGVKKTEQIHQNVVVAKDAKIQDNTDIIMQYSEPKSGEIIFAKSVKLMGNTVNQEPKQIENIDLNQIDNKKDGVEFKPHLDTAQTPKKAIDANENKVMAKPLEASVKSDTQKQSVYAENDIKSTPKQILSQVPKDINIPDVLPTLEDTTTEFIEEITLIKSPEKIKIDQTNIFKNSERAEPELAPKTLNIPKSNPNREQRIDYNKTEAKINNQGINTKPLIAVNSEETNTETKMSDQISTQNEIKNSPKLDLTGKPEPKASDFGTSIKTENTGKNQNNMNSDNRNNESTNWFPKNNLPTQEISKVGISDEPKFDKEIILSDTETESKESQRNIMPEKLENTVSKINMEHLIQNQKIDIAKPDISLKSQITSNVVELPDKITEYINSVKLLDNKNFHSITIQLDPPNLGDIKLKVSLKEDGIFAEIDVTKFLTKEMLETQLPDIKKSLMQHNIELSGFNITLEDSSTKFNSHDPNSSQQNKWMSGAWNYNNGRNQRDNQNNQRRQYMRYANSESLIDFLT